MNHATEPCCSLADQPPPDRVIGPYRIEATLGVGGMGTVHRAFDQRLQRPVALKHIGSEARRDPILRQRLLREARTAAQLCHPNIIQVYDILEQETGDWIVMELVEGGTLMELLCRERLDVPRVVSLALDISQGLAAAHAHGIVHRDLKPENILITPTGQAKILDFGVAKLQGLQETLSKAGQVVGTPRSMSPEQASGKQVDHRSDLFSLGVLLYETLTCSSPFRSETSVAETLDRICTLRQKPAHDIDQRIPPELSDLVDHLLEKDATHRFQSAEEVAGALRQLVGAPGGPQKILFVDDDPGMELLMRQKYRRQIQSGEIELFFARDGAHAWRILNEDNEICMVISDIQMPKLDGLTLLRRIQKLDRYLVTIVVSSFGDMRNIRSAMNLGAFDFLNKPIDFNELELTRKKAGETITWQRERRKLREENRFLHEHLDFLRNIFNRHLKDQDSTQKLVGSLANGPREVTVLRAEIRDFRKLPENLHTTKLHQVLNRIFRGLIRTVGEYQGVVHDFDQGKITAVFGLPLPQDNDVQRAVDCAVALRRAIAEISQQSSFGEIPALVLDVGIESGDTVPSLGAETPILISETTMNQCVENQCVE